MVVRERGMWKPLLLRAEKTRSSDSFTAASGRPTRMSYGRAGLAGVDLDQHGFGIDALQRGGMDGRQHAKMFPQQGKLYIRVEASPLNTPAKRKD